MLCPLWTDLLVPGQANIQVEHQPFKLAVSARAGFIGLQNGQFGHGIAHSSSNADLLSFMQRLYGRERGLRHAE
jgi:hypothetical protein